MIARGKEVEIGLDRGIGLEKRIVEARTTAEGIVGAATTKTVIGVGSLTAKTDTGTNKQKYVECSDEINAKLKSCILTTLR